MKKTNAAPFRVSAYWIDFAHGPGAEDGQPLATQLVEMADADPDGSVSVTDATLVAEIVDVAELYTFDSSVQDDDRLWFRTYPGKLIKRGKAWLKEPTNVGRLA